MKVDEAKLSLVGKARARPDQVRKVLDTVAQQGADGHLQEGHEQARLLHAARVLAVRRGRSRWAPGPRSSRSASWSRAPATSTPCTPSSTGCRSTCASPVPDGVAPEHAAFATVGAIAMQGVRRAEAAARRHRPGHRPRPGRPAGRPAAGRRRRPGRRAGHDRRSAAGWPSRRARCACARPGRRGPGRRRRRSLAELTGGLGADHVFLAAGGSSNAPVEIAARLARDRARVVDIGKTKLDLPWNAYYDKELDVRFSRSYGPGRYDDRYELEGIDYPAGYVRWTERRNLECFLDLLARKDIEVETLISGMFPMDEASAVYAELSAGDAEGGRVPVRVPGAGPRDRPQSRPPAWSRAGIPRRPRRRRAGRPAQPAAGHRLHRRRQLRLVDAAAAPGPAAERRSWPTSPPPGRCRRSNAQRRFGFATASTDAEAVLDDESLDAIFIVTRHATHADLVCRALRDRQGGVRGEAARADRRGARPDHRGDRQDRQRPADGRVQPALRADADEDAGRVRPGRRRRGRPLPGQRRARWPPTAGTATTSRGVPVHRRGRPLHRHAELVGRQPARGGVRGRRPGLRTTSRSPCGSATAPAA